MRHFVAAAASAGVHVKWFGAEEPIGFTSNWTSWRYADPRQELPNAARVLQGLCDLRMPLGLGEADMAAIVAAIAGAVGVSS
jgi:hypothetical protein